MAKFINIFQRDVHDLAIRLTKREGAFIKDEIKARISTSFPWFCRNLGVQPSNFYSIMDGTRSCTLQQLNKITSGAGLSIVLQQELVIQESEIGQNANNAHFLGHDDGSPLEEMADKEEYE